MKNVIITLFFVLFFISACSTQKNNSHNTRKSPQTNLTDCKSGGGWSCNQIGLLYSFGWQGFNQDYLQALDYFKKSCNLNHAPGCGNVSWLYREGKGIERNAFQAAFFATLACNLGEDWRC